MAKFSGFEVNDADVSPILKPHQPDIVKWAVRGGCHTILPAFGLGKVGHTIETLRLIHAPHAGGKGACHLPAAFSKVQARCANAER